MFCISKLLLACLLNTGDNKSKKCAQTNIGTCLLNSKCFFLYFILAAYCIC